VYTPHGGDERVAESAGRDLGVFEYYASAVAGLVVTGVLVVLVYPALVTVTDPLRMLSSTAIVFAVVLAWLLAWSAVELVWAWGSRRGSE
jgi:protein-S-isoprenylcysteine O-methyltransferase Ste14